MLFVTQKKVLSVHQIISKQGAFNFGQKNDECRNYLYNNP
jgi:hypothetical protein